MLGKIDKVSGTPVTNPAAKDALMKVLVGANEGWDDHVMRVFELEVGGYTPKHAHDWPHINVVLEGEGTLFLNGQENPVEYGAYAYIPGGELHQFKNAGNTTFKFICIVPKEGHK
jgi:quercetin dioxygenase-like cupin family protein